MPASRFVTYKDGTCCTRPIPTKHRAKNAHGLQNWGAAWLHSHDGACTRKQRKVLYRSNVLVIEIGVCKVCYQPYKAHGNCISHCIL